MAKGERTFAAKLAHSAKERGATCAKCGEKLQHVKQVLPLESTVNSAVKFNQRMIAVCKCNQKEVYG